MISLHFKTASITGTSLNSSIYFFILITGTVLVPSVIVVPCLLTSLSIIATTLSPYKPRSCLPFCPAPNKTYPYFLHHLLIYFSTILQAFSLKISFEKYF